ncbi:hypothetical protein Tco_0057023, partial [Tanacetum coccineum]
MKKNLNPAQFSRLLWIFSSKQISSELLQRHQQYRLSIFNNSGILFVLTVKPGVISVNWTSNGLISLKTHSETLIGPFLLLYPTPDTLIEFVNELGYPREVINLSNVTTNDMFQPWRALTTIINLRQEESGTTSSRKEESDSHFDPYAKGTKREVFGMTIPNELINNVIRGADYYDAYLEKVTKHQRYLAGEEVSDPDSPAPKPAKPARQTKPKPTKQSKPTEPKA